MGDDEDDFEALRKSLEQGLFGEEPFFNEDIYPMITTPKKCECGAESIGVQKHSSWCPKETK